MKKNKKMWILAILVLALAAVNWGLGIWSERSEQRAASEAEQAKVYLSRAEDVEACSYTDGEQTMAFTCQDQVWTCDADPEIPLNQSTIRNLADTLGQMIAVRELTDPDPLEDYGLTEPLYQIWYRDGDGTETEILVGNGVGENYYATVEGTGKVYTISSDFQTVLQFDLSSLVQHDTVPSLGSGNLVSITVTEAGQDTVYTESDQLGELAGGFGAMTLTECADYHVSEDRLAEYGLDDDQRITVTAVYTDDAEEEQTFVLYVGQLDTEGTDRYVMVEGSGMVYSVSDSIVQNLMTVEETEG